MFGGISHSGIQHTFVFYQEPYNRVGRCSYVLRPRLTTREDEATRAWPLAYGLGDSIKLLPKPPKLGRKMAHHLRKASILQWGACDISLGEVALSLHGFILLAQRHFCSGAPFSH